MGHVRALSNESFTRLSLWVVLVLPALQVVLLPAGPQLELFAAWKVFLLGLMLLELLNWLPTNYWLACSFISAGQLALLWEFLAGTSSSWAALGIWLMLTAVVTAYAISSRLRASSHPGKETAIDNQLLEDDDGQENIIRVSRRWLDFRDRYGSFWGLRILQRINQTADICQWPVRLQWWGYEGVSHGEKCSVPPEQLAQINRTLDTLLRRFF